MTQLNDLTDHEIDRQRELAQRDLAAEEARLEALQREQINYAISQQTPSHKRR